MAAAAPAYFICMANGWRARTRSPARLLFGVERDRHSAVQLRHFGTERSGVAAPKVLEGQRRTKFPRHSRVTETLGRSHGPTAWTDGRRDRRERKEGGTERSEEEDCRAERAHTHTHTHTHATILIGVSSSSAAPGVRLAITDIRQASKWDAKTVRTFCFTG